MMAWLPNPPLTAGSVGTTFNDGAFPDCTARGRSKLSEPVEFPLFEFKRPLLIAAAARRCCPKAAIVGSW
jgi:hypothetical protein